VVKGIESRRTGNARQRRICMGVHDGEALLNDS
jgi:hypothetical protein